MEYDTANMKQKLSELKLTITKEQEEQLIQFYELLIEWNKVMNLTGITEFEEVVEKHFIDSLSIVKVLDLSKVDNVIDVGTGAGFPGIPLKIVFPHLKITLLDSLNKRIKFLNEVIDKLALADIAAVHGRAEDLAKKENYREKFDLCVSRAVANISTLSEYCLPFVKCDGVFVSYKSGKVEEELEKGKLAFSVLGGKLSKKEDFYLPGSDIFRTLAVIKKIKKTPGKYPRKAGLPSKEPI